MSTEATDLADSLLYTLQIISTVPPADRARIAAAYTEAQRLVGTIPPSDDAARLRILACLTRFTSYKTTGDVAAAGWMLTALQERIHEGTLAHSGKFRIIANLAVDMLRASRSP